MPAKPKHIAVIGAGPAGVAAAKSAARLGVHVILIDPEPIGGRALWHSLVPSKVWLIVAEKMNGIKTASRFGFRNQKHSLDIAQVLENIKALQTEQGLEFEIHTTEYKSTLKPALLQKQEGWLRWVIDPKSQKILGAASMGEHAADVLIPVVVALRAHMTLKEFQEVNAAHPTLTEVLGK